MTDAKPPPAEAMQAARRALSRFDRYGPTHGDLTHEIAVEIAAGGDRRAAEAKRAAIEECVQIAAAEAAEMTIGMKYSISDDHACWLWSRQTAEHIEKAIRALADKPAASKAGT